MIRTFACSLLLYTLAILPATANAVSFDWALVGNPGNASDTAPLGEPVFGAVGHVYRISKHEVTNAQYTAFLNAVDPTGANTLALYNTSMSGNFGGIENTGTTDGARYVAQSGREQNPVTYVSFFDAMRFTNWLHNGQGNGDTETGTYTIGSGINEVRSASATYWIPSEDEWYKAAYHDASAGTAGVYFNYATGSDDIPISDQPADNPAAVNYFNDDGFANGFNDGHAVSGSTTISNSTNPFTDVGAYTDAESPYGTFDQNGNVWEWNEAVINSNTRVLRGGSWTDSSSSLRFRNGFSAVSSESRRIGFRVATVPEPSTMLILAMAAGGLLMQRWA